MEQDENSNAKIDEQPTSTPAEPTATEKVIESYKKMYKQEHEARLRAEKEANELARVMTNMSIQQPEQPKKQTFNELVDSLFGGRKNGNV